MPKTRRRSPCVEQASRPFKRLLTPWEAASCASPVNPSGPTSHQPRTTASGGRWSTGGALGGGGAPGVKFCAGPARRVGGEDPRILFGGTRAFCLDLWSFAACFDLSILAPGGDFWLIWVENGVFLGQSFRFWGVNFSIYSPFSGVLLMFVSNSKMHSFLIVDRLW